MLPHLLIFYIQTGHAMWTRFFIAVFTITMTLFTSCSVKESDQPQSQVPEASSNSPVYAGDNIQLTSAAPASVTSPTFSWSGPNGFSSNEQNPTITNATAADAGTYQVTVTGSNCPVSQPTTTSVIVNSSAPSSAITAPASITTKQEDTTSVIVNASPPSPPITEPASVIPGSTGTLEVKAHLCIKKLKPRSTTTDN